MLLGKTCLDVAYHQPCFQIGQALTSISRYTTLDEAVRQKVDLFFPLKNALLKIARRACMLQLFQ